MNTEKPEEPQKPQEPQEPQEKDIAQIFREGTAIEEALERSYRRTVKEHKQRGFPMVFWENGKIVEIPADQLPDLPID